MYTNTLCYPQHWEESWNAGTGVDLSLSSFDPMDSVGGSISQRIQTEASFEMRRDKGDLKPQEHPPGDGGGTVNCHMSLVGDREVWLVEYQLMKTSGLGTFPGINRTLTSQCSMGQSSLAPARLPS